MALSGIQIFKLLPNTNCKKCGFATCLAFAMRVAAKNVEAEACPDLSDEAKEVLGAASVPPISQLEIKSGTEKVKVGEELVMFRHEKKFFNKAAYAVCVKDTEDISAVTEKINLVKAFNYERAGEVLKFDLIAVKCESGKPEVFREVLKFVRETVSFPIILMSAEPEIIRAGLDVLTGEKPLIFSANNYNWEEMTVIAKTAGAPLVLTCENGLESLAELADKVKKSGYENIVLDPASASPAKMLEDYTLIRRFALEKSFKTLGHPTISYIKNDNSFIKSVISTCKYASIIVFDDLKDWERLPLLTLRQNIFTDPQKPLQVDPGIYSVGEPDENSPVFVTTNFSLTYFILSTEIEGAGYSGHLVATDAEGLSVLTAWSAGKFSGEIVGKFMQRIDIASRVSHKNVIIPGYVAVISGELEDSLPGWKVMVGPPEASDLSSYLKEFWN